jgi:polar amino acid transport system permease protein
MESWHRVVWPELPLYIEGFGVTVYICVLSYSVAVISGLLLALANMYVRWLYLPTTILIEYLRNTPILAQLLWVAYVWPELFGWPNSFLAAGIVALALQATGYMSETFRTGIQAVAQGQQEAGLALGLSKFTIFRRIVIPQGVLVISPALMNQFVMVVKSSTLVSIISVPDLMYQALRQNNIWYEPIPILSTAALFYITAIYFLSYVQQRIVHYNRLKYGF